MTEEINKNLVPPSKRTVHFFYQGLIRFYPESIYGAKEGKKRAVLNYWTETGYQRTDFVKLLWNTTKTEDTDQAAKIVLGWKKLWDKNTQPGATVPENLDELLSSLDENTTETKKASAYKTQVLAKKALLESQKIVDESSSEPLSEPEITTAPDEVVLETDTVTSTPIPDPEMSTSSAEIISQAAGPLSILAGKMLTAPIKALAYFSGPKTYASSASGEGPGVATARYMLVRGISSSSIRSLESRSQQLGITPNQLKNLANLIKTEQKAHPFSFKWISVINSGQKASLSQAQISSLLTPSVNGSTAVLPRRSFIGGALGRMGQQLFGKLSSKAIKTVSKKVASKVMKTIGTQAAGSVIPGVGNIVMLVTQFVVDKVLSKVKDFISKLKTKEGKEKALTFLLGGMIIGGLFLGGPIGAALLVGGLVPGIGLMAAKAGGFGSLGTSIGSYGQAFMSGITGAVFPALAGPLIVSFVSVPLMIAVILFIINSGAYLVPPKASHVAGLIESPYIGVVKTASPSDPLENSDLPITIDYKVEVIAKKGTLSNIQFEDVCKVIKDGSSPSCSSPSSPTPEEPVSISPTSSFSFSYSRTYSSPTFEDSLIIDTFTVTADAPEKQGAQTAAAASVIIGDPPDECPNGWPGYGGLTQGAYAPYTHRNAEAIDIGLGVGNTITARHTGVVRAFGNIGPYGKHVEIVSVCGGKEFYSRYAHLSVVSVRTGEMITMGETVGLSGNTGNSTGPHLHYEFRDPSGPKKYPSNPPYMMTPYVPKDLPRGCVGRTTCKTNIP